MKIFLSSGEVSGDLIGGYLAAALRDACPAVSIAGVGGSRMAGEGVRILFDTNHLGSVGFTEPLTTLPDLLRLFGCIRRSVREEAPDAAVLIGNDLFNALLGRWLRGQGIRTVAFFPPQVWVWRSVARMLAKSFDEVLASFPEEETVYGRAGARVAFVGHYLADKIQPVTPELRLAARERLGLSGRGAVVGLLPGSRNHELRYLAPVLLEAARTLIEEDGSRRFVLPLAEPDHEPPMRRLVETSGLAGHVVVNRDSREAMRCCDLALLASGTATLEAAFLELPMVVVYRVSRLTMLGLRPILWAGLIRSETVGLPNLLAGRMIVPELRQERATAPELVVQARLLLGDAQRLEEMRQDLRNVTATLGSPGSLRRAAGHILNGVERSIGSVASCASADAGASPQLQPRPTVPVVTAHDN